MILDFEPIECEYCWALISPARVDEHMATHRCACWNADEL